MKIRMLEQRSGARYDGRAWPVPGEDFDVPADEGNGLILQGSAEKVTSGAADEGSSTPDKAVPEPGKSGLAEPDVAQAAVTAPKTGGKTR